MSLGLLVLLLVNTVQFGGAVFCALPSVKLTKVLRLDCEWNSGSGKLSGINLDPEKVRDKRCVGENFVEAKIEKNEEILANKLLSEISCLTFYDGVIMNSIPDNGLEKLASLETLYLSSKKLKKISKLAFAKNKKLAKIDLKNNNLSDVSSVFSGLPLLNTLNLQGNQLSQIKYTDLASLHNLRKLFLLKNRISKFANRPFRDLQQLHLLELQGNKFTSIESGLFENLRSLHALRLSDNKISVLNNDTFRGLINVKIIDLAKNKLRFIHENTFTLTPNLKQLHLQGNALLEFDAAWLMKINRSSLEEIHVSSKDFNCAYNIPNHPLYELRRLNVTLVMKSSDSETESTPCQYTPLQRRAEPQPNVKQTAWFLPVIIISAVLVVLLIISIMCSVLIARWHIARQRNQFKLNKPLQKSRSELPSELDHKSSSLHVSCQSIHLTGKRKDSLA